MGILSRHKKEKEKAETYFKSVGSARCPYFSCEIIFNADGFHHLQFSAGSERNKSAQMLKFSLLEDAVKVIKKSGTIQEYRKQWGVVGRKKVNGEHPMKEIEYWGLTAIVGDCHKKKIKVVLRRIGKGNITFWSVMPMTKKNKDTFGLAEGDITEG